MKVLVSPTDSELARVLGYSAIISSLPEEKGADVLVYTKQGLFGVQRKKLPHDFILSIEDGRLARETSLLSKSCKFALLICEGKFRYYPDERLALIPGKPSRYTRGQIHGMLYDIKYVKGVDYDYTEDIEHTARYIKFLADFMDKEKHLGLYTRPGAKGKWIIPTSRDIDLWLLQGFPGIGPTIAESIIKTCGGRIPLRWACSYSELLSAPGLGRKRARMLWESLESGPAVVEPVHGVFDQLRRGLEEFHEA